MFIIFNFVTTSNILKKTGQVRVGLAHEGFRTIIYKHFGNNTSYIIYSRIFVVIVATEIHNL